MMAFGFEVGVRRRSSLALAALLACLVLASCDEGSEDEMCTSHPDRPERTCSCMDAATVVVVACESDGEPTCYQYTSACVDPGFTVCPPSEEAADPDLWDACVGFCRDHGAEPWAFGCDMIPVVDAGAASDRG